MFTRTMSCSFVETRRDLAAPQEPHVFTPTGRPGSRRNDFLHGVDDGDSLRPSPVITQAIRAPSGDHAGFDARRPRVSLFSSIPTSKEQIAAQVAAIVRTGLSREADSGAVGR
ncbi:MAG: hypothetical protein MZU95_00470 [Desulfomicrobium escambiense]|nr:hypothetical protein [Desulfomicrobium escambiense]